MTLADLIILLTALTIFTAIIIVYLDIRFDVLDTKIRIIEDAEGNNGGNNNGTFIFPHPQGLKMCGFLNIPPSNEMYGDYYCHSA